MATPWYQYPIIQGFKWGPTHTQAHSGEDVGTPYGTPLTAPVSGAIISQGIEPWGGQVNELVGDPNSGQQYVLSFLHTSRLAPHTGHVNAGDPIGATGAPPAGGPYGSGAHLHFEATTGNQPPYMSSYNPWYPTSTSHPVDSKPWLQAAQGGGSCDWVAFAECVAANQGDMEPCLRQYPACVNTAVNTANDPLGIGSAFSGLESGAATFGKRAGVFLLALAGVGFGFYLLTHPGPDKQAPIVTQIEGAIGNLPVKISANTGGSFFSRPASASAGASGSKAQNAVNNVLPFPTKAKGPGTPAAQQSLAQQLGIPQPGPGRNPAQKLNPGMLGGTPAAKAGKAPRPRKYYGRRPRGKPPFPGVGNAVQGAQFQARGLQGAAGPGVAKAGANAAAAAAPLRAIP